MSANYISAKGVVLRIHIKTSNLNKLWENISKDNSQVKICMPSEYTKRYLTFSSNKEMQTKTIMTKVYTHIRIAIQTKTLKSKKREK
jgi:hypothetical protein